MMLLRSCGSDPGDLYIHGWRQLTGHVPRTTLRVREAEGGRYLLTFDDVTRGFPGLAARSMGSLHPPTAAGGSAAGPRRAARASA